jgi:DNA-binding transcriptional ArsR family regulator
MDEVIAIDRLSALAHSGRLCLFRCLVEAGQLGLTPTALAALSGQAMTTVSNQLLVLTRAGLVTVSRKGRGAIYRAAYPEISALLGYLMEDCCCRRDEILAPLTTSSDCC